MSELEILKIEQDEYLPTIWESVKLLLMYVVLMFIPTFLLMIVYALFKLPVDPLMHGLASVGGLGLLIVWLRRKRSVNLKQLFSTNGIATAHYVPMVLVVFGVSVILSECDNLFRTYWPMSGFWSDALGTLTSGNTGLWKSALAVAVIAPVVEEILFRGLILRGFLKHYSVNKAIVVSSLLFALFHMNPWQFLAAFIYGLITAWWFVRTGSLVMCIFIHALNNSKSYILRALGIHIPGFTGSGGVIEFQPMWFNALGLITLAVGVVVLYNLVRKQQSREAPLAVER
ncbi:MAG: type II CAAX endopeptidase family protein [Bacillota bacterium]|nr:type II CAAX endopeptidase family protein [Bacillota bacterium]